MSVCFPVKNPFVDQQITYSTTILPRVSSILFKSVFELTLLEAAIWRPSISPEETLWSGSGTTLSAPRLEDALTDFIASSSLGKTTSSIAVNAVSCTLASTVVITLSTSLPTLLKIIFPSVSKTNCGTLAWVWLFVLFKVAIPAALLVLSSNRISRLFYSVMKSVSDSFSWLRSLLFCCLFFQVETILKSTNEINNQNEQLKRNEQKIILIEISIANQFWGFWRHLALLSQQSEWILLRSVNCRLGPPRYLLVRFPNRIRRFMMSQLQIKLTTTLNKTAGWHRHNFCPNTNILINFCKRLKTKEPFWH